jgi:phage FluMu protein Com
MHIYMYIYIYIYIYIYNTYTCILLQIQFPVYHKTQCTKCTQINKYYINVRTGSHQNVLTMRMVEEFSLSAKYVKILNLSDFPG